MNVLLHVSQRCIFRHPKGTRVLTIKNKDNEKV
nr:MAG TPA: hypothetical protein [Caudoviricetes sp.]